MDCHLSNEEHFSYSHNDAEFQGDPAIVISVILVDLKSLTTDFEDLKQEMEKQKFEKSKMKLELDAVLKANEVLTSKVSTLEKRLNTTIGFEK